MTTLPPYHVPTKYEGYYYDVQNKKLYSTKQAGELRKMATHYPNRFNQIIMPGYYISDKGKRRFVTVAYLRSLTIFDTIVNSREVKK